MTENPDERRPPVEPDPPTEPESASRPVGSGDAASNGEAAALIAAAESALRARETAAAEPEDEQAAKRDAARIRAGELLAGQKRRERRRRILVSGSIALVLLLAVGGVLAVLLTGGQRSGRGPAIAHGGGIPVSAAEVLLATPSASATPNPSASASASASPAPSPDASASAGSGAIPIRIYVDYAASTAAPFQRANAASLATWVTSGAATLEVHPIAISSAADDPSRYSIRAANAAACVAELAPSRFYAFSSRLMLAAPKNLQQAPADARLLALAADAKVGHASALKRCVGELRFERWLTKVSTSALNGPLPDSDLRAIDADQTPAVIVGGKHYPWSDPSDENGLALFFASANGGEFNEESTASPTPTATPDAASPTPTP